MNLKKLFNSLTDSSKVLLTVGVVSLLLDFFGQEELDRKFAAGFGMLMWLGIMVYQNQCLGPRNCSNYSWLLVILLVIGMLIKMYYINIQGLSRKQFKSILESSNTLPNNDIERFCSACPASDPNCPRCDDYELQEGEEKFTNGGCGNKEESSCPKPENPEDQPIGMRNVNADDARLVGGVLAGVGRGAGAIFSGGQWGFEEGFNNPLNHNEEEDEETGELFEGFSQSNTST